MGRWIAYGVLMVGAGVAAPCEGGQPDFRVTGLSELASAKIPDCDGAAAGDIDGDGDVDILASASRKGEVFWFEQRGSPRRWKRREVHEVTYDGPKIEGNALGDFNGDGRLEGISLDQAAARVLLHTPGDEPADPWKTVTVQGDRQMLQDALAVDLTGDGGDELVYAWEGNKKGRGGVSLLRFDGERMCQPDDWSDHRLTTQESSWWLVPRPLDLNGDGKARELVFTARHTTGRNPGSRPGIFWLEPSGAVTARWRKHAIATDLPHPLHVDAGRLNESGPAHDIVVGGFQTESVHAYHAGADWQHHKLTPPRFAGRSITEIWNVKALDLPGDRRDAVLAVAADERESAVVLFEWADGRYRANVIKQYNYVHAMEDRIIPRDLTGDGWPELIIPDSGGGRLRVMKLTRAD